MIFCFRNFHLRNWICIEVHIAKESFNKYSPSEELLLIFKKRTALKNRFFFLASFELSKYWLPIGFWKLKHDTVANTKMSD